MATRQKTFSFHWGSGVIAEEAQVEGHWHRPTLQLMKYTDGEAAGHVSVRFCTYTPRGRFSRSPLMMSGDDIELMRDALKKTPKLLGLLKQLVE